MQHLKIYFIEISSDERTCFAGKTAKWLNRSFFGPHQKAFNFEVLPVQIDVEDISSAHAPYYTDQELLPAINARLDERHLPGDAIVVAFTSLRLAKAIMKKGRAIHRTHAARLPGRPVVQGRNYTRCLPSLCVRFQ